jgi:TonB family protein
MTFQALLFCPDDRTARLVTQVLNELEFSVEPCTEPFAAVKKLMGKHFDAVVVDAENEQNASLLFKSARNSQANQGALAVAVVEGQAGVANAFRVGANLVLTKPINVEQAKSTLRVARGLLRKGTDAKTTASPAPAAVASKPAAPAVKVPSAPASTPPKPPFPAAVNPQRPVGPSTKPSLRAEDLFETAENAPAAAREEETLLHIPEEKAPAPPPQQQYPWQPVSKPAGAMASSLPGTLEEAKITAQVAPAAKTPPKSTLTPPPATPVRAQSGAASAPAPALEVTRTTPALFAGQAAPPAQSAAPLFAEPLLDVAEPPEPISAPSFAALDLQEGDDGSGGAKKGILVAVAAVVLVTAGYFGYTKFAGHKQAEPSASVPVQPQASAPAASPAAGPAASQELDITVGGTSSAPAPAAVTIERTPVHTTAKSNTGTTSTSASMHDEDEGDVTVTHPDTPALVVKSDVGTTPKPQPAPVETVAPPALGSLSDEDSSALSALVKSAPASVPRVAPAQGPIKVSQGVTQGLIIKRVQPVYPQQALQMRVHGTVLLQAEISKTGDISNIKVLSGESILANAAVRAVSQWKYKPYFLNGEPVDIQTQITVNFKLPSE